MTLAFDAPPQPLRPASRPPVGGRLLRAWSFLALDGSDALALAALGLLWALLFVLGWDRLMMQLWDESRNANNAWEMAHNGRWLAPTYAGVVDHWNTKPPLLIWLQAGLIHAHLPLLMAVRLPSWLAAAATVGVIWGVLRHALLDRMAAFFGGVLLLSATAYVGAHGARTGDFDALESLFILGYVLAFWRAFEDGRTRWIVMAAVLMALGVLTKGVAALLPMPGLFLYALTRPGRLWAFLKDGRTWAAASLFVAVAAGYYGLRERADPGYLRAVTGNELGGRFLQVTENHRGSWHFYLTQMALHAEPCALFSALGLLTLLKGEAKRRRLVLAAGLAGASLLVVLSLSRSKMTWYITPLVPLLAPIAAVGLADGLRWMQQHRRRSAPLARGLAALALAAGAVFAVGSTQLTPWLDARGPDGVHSRYGPFLEAVRTRASYPALLVLDHGFRNDAGFAAYDPMLKLYAGEAGLHGLAVEVIHALPASPGRPVASCDPRALAELARLSLTPVLDSGGCRLYAVRGR